MPTAPDAATNSPQFDDPLAQAMIDHLLSENASLQGQVDTLKGILNGSQKTIDVLTNDLKKRGEQIAQLMLNLAEIAGAAKQQTKAVNDNTAALSRTASAIRDAIVPKEA